MKRIVSIAIFCLVFFSLAEAAEECSTVLNENEAVNRENVRNQDSVGWCYAYAASDLVSFRLKKRISAVSLYDSGQSIQKDIETEAGKGGDIGYAIRNYIARKNSLCLEEDLPSTDFKFCTWATYSEFLNALYQSAESRNLSSDQCLSENLKAAFPMADFGVLKNYTDKNGAKNLVEYLFDLHCKKPSFKGIKLNPVNQYTPRHTKDVLMKKIDALLSKGDIVGMGSEWEKLRESEEKTGGHATVVVGRKKNPESGECEYLVRNSWGKNCDEAEGEGLTCDMICEGSQCRYTGYLWVGSRRMKNSLLGITYLP